MIRFGFLKGLVVLPLELGLSVNMDPLNQVVTFFSRMIIAGIKVNINYIFFCNKNFFFLVNAKVSK